ncbi:MAG: type II toxin-antitoxin system RelE/ParE family toxin [Xanthobacteraceae bacterium]
MIDRLKPIPVAFWRSASGREPVREWLRALGKGDRAVIGHDLRMLQFGWPIGMPLVRKLADHLWEVRSSLPSRREARLLFTANEEQIVVLSAFIKKSQKTPAAEIEMARRRLKELLQ